MGHHLVTAWLAVRIARDSPSGLGEEFVLNFGLGGGRLGLTQVPFCEDPGLDSDRPFGIRRDRGSGIERSANHVGRRKLTESTAGAVTNEDRKKRGGPTTYACSRRSGSRSSSPKVTTSTACSASQPSSPVWAGLLAATTKQSSAPISSTERRSTTPSGESQAATDWAEETSSSSSASLETAPRSRHACRSTSWAAFRIASLEFIGCGCVMTRQRRALTAPRRSSHSPGVSSFAVTSNRRTAALSPAPIGSPTATISTPFRTRDAEAAYRRLSA